MNTWKSADVANIVGQEEIHIRTRRADGSLRRPRIIWVVGGGERIFIRSTNGRGADWFRWAIATREGALEARGAAYDVVFREADPADLATIDAGYREKYGRYASIVDHLLTDGPRAATFEVFPA
ncbi:MAG: DUF2255 family protein [Tetrasphaera sp.]